jgi:Ricin-type beta-trefoil lectin domain-like
MNNSKFHFNLLLILLVFSTQLMAQDSGTYYIQSATANKYLDVSGGERGNGTPLILNDFTGGTNQKFYVKNIGAGNYLIKSELGRFVHVFGGTDEPQSLVTLWDYADQDNLKWRFANAGDGYYYIKSRVGTYMDVQWGKSANGTPIWMWGFSGTNAQKWRLVKTEKAAAPATLTSTAFSNWYTTKLSTPHHGSLEYFTLSCRYRVVSNNKIELELKCPADFEFYITAKICSQTSDSGNGWEKVNVKSNVTTTVTLIEQGNCQDGFWWWVRNAKFTSNFMD